MTLSFTIVAGADRQPEVVDNAHWNYSDFQVKHMEQIGKRPKFEHFVTHGHTIDGDRPRKSGPVNVLWYEDGKLHAIRLGVRAVMCDEIISG